MTLFSSCILDCKYFQIYIRKLLITRALLFQNNVEKQYWREAVLTTTYLNRLPSRSLNSHSPIQLFTMVFPGFNASNDLTPIEFACLTFVHIHTPNRGKLDPRALQCVFIGYSSTQKGYKWYHSPTKKFVELMLALWKIIPTLIVLILRGRVPSWKKRTWIYFFLTFLLLPYLL